MNLDGSAQVDAKLPTPWRKLLVTRACADNRGRLRHQSGTPDARRLERPRSGARAVYPAAALVGQMLVAPLAIAWLGTGVALALLTPWGLRRYWWTTIKLTITVVLTVVVLLVLVPRLGAAADAARATTPHAAEQRSVGRGKHRRGYRTEYGPRGGRAHHGVLHGRAGVVHRGH